LPRRPETGQAGFGLLEVLVSLVIFASVGFTVLAWFEQSVTTVQRLRGFYELQDARKTVLEMARSINPAQQPSGEVKLGALRLAWASVPDGDEVQQIGFPRGEGRHRLRLYTTNFTAYRQDQTEPWFAEKLTLIGYTSSGPRTGMFGDV
jgi:general secretion pathway protein I